MGILRADVISHSQLSDGNASVLFDGTTDRLTIPSHSAFAFGTSDWTVEGWFYFTSITGQQTLVGDTYGNTAGFYLYKQNNHKLGVYYSSLLVDGTATIEVDRWYHFAFVRNSGRTRIYINGELDAEGADTTDATITQYYIGDTAQSSGEFFGNISNLRITRTAVYKDNFTVPKFKLKEIPGTILLCCQSSSSTTETTVSVPGTLTTGGDPTATNFGPGLKDDTTDTGVVFDGFGNFVTSSYMVPPSGKTTERNRGRGVMSGGETPSKVNTIAFTHIQSSGTFQDFGDLIGGDAGETRGVGSSTRGVFFTNHGGSSGQAEDLEFITFANQSNGTDFGDLPTDHPMRGSAGNETRGIFAGGYKSSLKNEIEFITIATTGNGTDFGNLSGTRNAPAGLASLTRALFGGGGSPSNINNIDIVTIATTGDASDFGDLTRTGKEMGGVASNTRGVFAGARINPSTASNVIDFVTIASAGNATDFGDLTQIVASPASMTDSIRGLFAGGYTPSPSFSRFNSIDFINIATTGNASDFGDLTYAQNYGGGCSDSHGGLS